MWIVSLVDTNCTVYVVDSGGREFTVFMVDKRCIVSVVNTTCTINIAIIHNSTKRATLKQKQKTKLT